MYTIDKVIEGNYCVGCGVCAALQQKPYEMNLKDDGYYKANFIGDSEQDKIIADKVCPFSDNSKNEDEIGQYHFDKISDIKKDSTLGYYLDLYAGNVQEDSYRVLGSSGGGVSWLLKEMLELNLIDGVIHVKESDSKNKIFEYAVSHNLQEVRDGAKSRYYPIELSNALSQIRNDTHGKRYAVVGIPCFIKGLRNLAMNDDEINDKIKFYVGIVCGHLKSKNFASLFAWQHGIHPDKLVNIDFRHKVRSNDAALYAVKLTYKDNKGNEKVKITDNASELYGTDWGLGFFKYKACDYCDDIFAETADVVFGDAWVKGYREDWRGDNIVLTRNKTISKIIKQGINDAKVRFDPVDENLILKTQSGSIRHRRRGLAYRLRLKKMDKVWIPKKRVEPLQHKESEKYMKVQNYRMWFVDNVNDFYRQALSRNSFFFFKRKLFIPILRYKLLVYGIKGILPSKIKIIYRLLFRKKK